MKNLLLLLFTFMLSTVAVDAQSHAYIPNFIGNDVSVVDLMTNTVVTTIGVGDNPFSAATNTLNQKVYVANRGSNSVSVIDATTNTVETTITVGVEPQVLTLSPDGSRLYVPNKLSGSLTVINTTDNSVVTTIADVGMEPYSAAVSPDGDLVYVTANASNAVTVIDAVTNTVSTSIPISSTVTGIRINAAGTKAYVAVSATFGSVKVIDLATNMITNTIDVGSVPIGLDIGGVNFDKLYVANRSSGNVSVIDLTTETIETTIFTGGEPVGVAASDDGGTIYTSNFTLDALNTIDAATNMNTGSVTVGDGPWSLGSFLFGGALAGDECDDATDISAQFGGPFNEPQTTGLFDNTDFTVGADDPANGIDCFYDGDAIQNSGYYSFTGDGNTYRVRSVQCTGMSENLDLQVAVYTGTCGSLTDVACNEDEDGANGIFNISVELDTEEGVEYLMLIDGFDGATGEFCIEVTNLTDPDVLLPGEMCTNAIDISALTGQAEMVPQVSDQYNNTEYDSDDTDPAPSCVGALSATVQTIWFTFTGDGNRYTINSANNSNPGSELAGVLYSGECAMLTEEACFAMQGVPEFSIEIATEAGVEYSLLVFPDFFDQSNTFNLEFTNQGPTGVTDLAGTEFQIFPNPTTGWVQLPQMELERVEAYDATGRLVLDRQTPATRIDLSAQPAGLYLLKLYNGEEVYSAKVVKE